jgi:hypothetical protein
MTRYFLIERTQIPWPADSEPWNFSLVYAPDRGSDSYKEKPPRDALLSGFSYGSRFTIYVLRSFEHLLPAEHTNSNHRTAKEDQGGGVGDSIYKTFTSATIKPLNVNTNT